MAPVSRPPRSGWAAGCRSVERHFSRPSADGGADVLRASHHGSYALTVETKGIVGGQHEVAATSTREAILRLLAVADVLLETNEIVEGVQRLGVDSAPATTRSLLSKMAEAGQIRKVRRGLYGAADNQTAVSLDQRRPAVLWPTDLELRAGAQFVVTKNVSSDIDDDQYHPAELVNEPTETGSDCEEE